MDNEKEIQELKNRIASLENQVQNKPKVSNALKFILTIVIVFVVLMLLMFVIGIYNYTSGSN